MEQCKRVKGKREKQSRDTNNEKDRDWSVKKRTILGVFVSEGEYVPGDVGGNGWI